MNSIKVRNDILFSITDNRFPFAITSIGTNRWQESVTRATGHPDYHWLQTEKGIGIIKLPDRKIELSSSMGILIPPFTPHSYSSITNDWFTSFFTISGALADQIVTILGTNNSLLVNVNQIVSLFELLSSSRATNEIILNDIEQIESSVACFEFLISLKKNIDVDIDNTLPIYQELVQPVIDYMQAHLHEKIYLKQLANIVHISPQYLCRLFQRFTANSPYQYLKLMRIAKAKELLKNSPELPIHQIGELTGFNDTSLFIKTFKQLTGETPTKFR